MDYYEELGVPRSASADEVRHAWKVLVRLLHPDLYEDRELRTAAELQMRRLSEIVAILTNPAKRNRYDSEIAMPRSYPNHAQPVSLIVSNPLRSRWYSQPVIWFAFGAIVASLAWFAVSDRSVRPAAPSTPAVAEQEISQRREPSGGEDLPQSAARRKPVLVAAHAAGPRAVVVPTPQVGQQDAKLFAEGSLSAASGPPKPDPREAPSIAPPADPALALPSAVPAVMPALAAPALSRSPGGVPLLEGEWIYIKPKSQDVPKQVGLYPPVYIETSIFQDDTGALRGHYRARYEMTNQAFSPDVAFDFHGRATGDRATLAWTGNDGATGEIRLAQVGRELRVNWITTRAGRVRALVSGTAVLTRID